MLSNRIVRATRRTSLLLRGVAPTKLGTAHMSSLRINEGVDIPIRRSSSLELLSGFMETADILPEVLPAAPVSTGRRLGVNTVSQKPRDEWCWAACAEMVLRFLG